MYLKIPDIGEPIPLLILNDIWGIRFNIAPWISQGFEGYCQGFGGQILVLPSQVSVRPACETRQKSSPSKDGLLLWLARPHKKLPARTILNSFSWIQ